MWQTTDAVARYYDRNTRWFLRLGRGGGRYAIHRLLWGPGVTSPDEAASYVNVLLARALATLDVGNALRILDVGCGVGGTAFHLARAFPEGHVVGVTLSPSQVAMARDLAVKEGLDRRCRFLHQDFHHMDPGEPVSAAVAVEAFVHARSPEAFLAAVAARLTPGAPLLVVDDFLSHPEDELPARARRRLEAFRRGWRAPSVCTPHRLREAAEGAGMEPVAEQDLTELIQLRRPRDRMLAAIAPFLEALGLGRFPFFSNLIGGNALHHGLADGWISYRIFTLRKRLDSLP